MARAFVHFYRIIDERKKNEIVREAKKPNFDLVNHHLFDIELAAKFVESASTSVNTAWEEISECWEPFGVREAGVDRAVKKYMKQVSTQVLYRMVPLYLLGDREKRTNMELRESFRDAVSTGDRVPWDGFTWDIIKRPFDIDDEEEW
ncbi:hypothetical protein ABW19_dt0206859 [Dactylella cylindrospora]|nr:hypothetical protein ABW19_dt0206859 [Dactylella cylindrospora]